MMEERKVWMIVNIILIIFFVMTVFVMKNEVDEAQSKGYHQGYEEGYEEGYGTALLDYRIE